MKRKIIYIINPISGTRAKKAIRQTIEEKTSHEGIPFHVFPSVASGDYSFLHSLIREEKITDIVIAGGDGTVSQVAGSLMQFDLNFGVIPCGSGNGLALTAGIPRKTEKALDIIFNGKPKYIDGFYVNNRFACMLCGLGFDAKIAHEFADRPKRGLSTYATLVGKNFFTARPWPFIVNSNNIEFSTEAFFISIANSNQFGNNFTIAPKAVLSDGLLDVVVVKKTAKPLMLLTVLKQVLAGQLRNIENSLRLPVIYFQTKELIIQNPSAAPLHIDGDPAECPEKISFKIQPRCFRLIHPG